MVLNERRFMELGARIKEHRKRCGLSQEDLAIRVFVARQTVSNWETDKTYPDVQSLLLLAELFHTSIDELVKGDLAFIEKTIDRDVQSMRRLNRQIIVLLLAAVAVFVALAVALPQPSGFRRCSVGELAGITACIPLFIWACSCAGSIEAIKREHNLVTYREIAAYMNGDDCAVHSAGFSRKHPLGAIALKMCMGAGVGCVLAAVVAALLGALRQ